jgi:hypothetical protein
MLFAALLLAHACPIPRVAYKIDRTLTRVEYRRLERYGACVCSAYGRGKSIDIDYDVYRAGDERRYRFHPSCGDSWK